MKLTEDDLRQLYEESTAPGEAEACFETDLLIRAAQARLGDSEREAVAGHIARCSECARAYRVARSMRALTDRPALVPHRVRAFAAGAIAATLLLFVPGLIWLVLLRERDQTTIAALRNTIAVRDQRAAITATAVPNAPILPTTTPAAVANIADLTRPQLDAPIVDLDSDVTRGADAAATIVVPEKADLLTTILHLDEPSRAIAIAIEGPARWSGSWRADTPAATLPLTLHRRSFPSGAYVVRARAGARETSYSFRVDWR